MALYNTLVYESDNCTSFGLLSQVVCFILVFDQTLEHLYCDKGLWKEFPFSEFPSLSTISP